MFKVFSYFTKGTPYENEAQKLIDSLNKFEIPRIIQPVESRGSWIQNVAMKPQLLLDILHDVDHDILYVDADAEFLQYPKMIDKLTSHIALHKRKGTEVLSGTIFIKNENPALELISDWVSLQRQHPLTWDQKTLAMALKRKNSRLVFEQLPASYTKIFDKMEEVKHPVIVHNQASRRYKRVVQTKDTKFDTPEVLFGRRVRIQDDGTIYIPRVTKDIERKMSKNYVKINNENRWYPKSKDVKDVIDEIKPYFNGKVVHLVAKGPSLDKITADRFKDGNPIICTNEAIHKIEELDIQNPVFCVQQDHQLKDTCTPSRGILLVSFRARRAYEDFDRKYVYYPEIFGGCRTTLSALMGIKIARTYGCTGFKLHAFDAATKGDTGYSESIPYPPSKGGDPKRFLSHRARLEAAMKNLDYEFIP